MTEAAFDARTHDLEYVAPARHTLLERTFLPKLRDERDLIFVNTAARLTLLVVVPGLLLFVPGVFRWWMAPLWAAWLAKVGFGPYILMLHCVSHRPTFKKGVSTFWSKYVPWLLGPFFGQSPDSYYIHHLGMHHAEGNLNTDLSSTMAYRRDSLAHWLHYWARFVFFGYLHVPTYLSARKKDRLRKRFIAGELAWWIGAALLIGLAPGPAITVFVIPMMLIRTFFMSGNWGQHAFVDVDDPNNPYKNSNNLTNHRYNRRCFNDGYHIVHHLTPALHWSEMPAAYYDNWQTYAEQDAIVFDALGNNQTVWFCLMTKNYEKLAKHMVVFPGRERTVQERIEFLKSRTQRQKGEWPSLIKPDRDLGPVVVPWRPEPTAG